MLLNRLLQEVSSQVEHAQSSTYNRRLNLKLMNHIYLREVLSPVYNLRSNPTIRGDRLFIFEVETKAKQILWMIHQIRNYKKWYDCAKHNP